MKTATYLTTTVNTAQRWARFSACTIGFTLAWIFILVGGGGLVWNMFADPVVPMTSPVVPTTAPVVPTTTPVVSTPPPVASTKTPHNRQSIMFIGDSITQLAADPDSDGWSALIQNDFVRSLDVENRGLYGWNTVKFIKHALPTIIEELETQASPVAITLWLGANDASLEYGPNKLQHVSLELYKANLVQILSQLHVAAPDAKLILMTPPVVDEDTRRRIQVAGGGPSDPIDRSNEQVAVYAAACGEVAAAVSGVDLLDIHSQMMTSYPNATERGALLEDGLHLSKSGNRFVFDQLKARLESLLTAQRLRKPQIDDP